MEKFRNLRNGFSRQLKKYNVEVIIHIGKGAKTETIGVMARSRRQAEEIAKKNITDSFFVEIVRVKGLKKYLDFSTYREIKNTQVKEEKKDETQKQKSNFRNKFTTKFNAIMSRFDR